MIENLEAIVMKEKLTISKSMDLEYADIRMDIHTVAIGLMTIKRVLDY